MAEAGSQRLPAADGAEDDAQRRQRRARRFDLKLRTIGSAGEKLGRETYEWARSALGVTVNEFYGQTECNYVLGSSRSARRLARRRDREAGPRPRVAIIDDDGRELPAGDAGEIAIRRPDPVMFLGYWNEPEATREQIPRRLDDDRRPGRRSTTTAISVSSAATTTSSPRPATASARARSRTACSRHPAVAMAAAVGKPDPLRTEIVKAFVVLKPGYAPSRRACRRDPAPFVRDAPLGRRISARGRIRRRDAAHHHRQGDPAGAARRARPGSASGNACLVREHRPDNTLHS